jgi:Flp pilus assembly protein TadB
MVYFPIRPDEGAFGLLLVICAAGITVSKRFRIFLLITAGIILLAWAWIALGSWFPFAFFTSLLILACVLRQRQRKDRG